MLVQFCRLRMAKSANSKNCRSILAPNKRPHSRLRAIPAVLSYVLSAETQEIIPVDQVQPHRYCLPAHPHVGNPLADEGGRRR